MNGADPESSMARGPAPVADIRLSSRPRPAAPAGGRPDAGAAAPDAPTAPAAESGAQAGPRAEAVAGDGSWAEGSRQAGATIEHLRSPLGAIFVCLVILATLLGRRRRALAAEQTAVAVETPTAPGPPPGSEA